LGDEYKTKEQLISEIIELRKQVAELRAVGKPHRDGPDSSPKNNKQRKQTVTTAERYRDIFEKSIVGIFQSSPDGRCLTVNNAFAKIFGYGSPEELINTVQDVGKQIYASSDDRIRCINRLLDSGSCAFEIPARRKDGSKIWVYNNVRLVRNDEGRVLYYEGMVIDITRRKQVEEELKQYRRGLEEMVQKRTDKLLKTNLRLRREILERKKAEKALRLSEEWFSRVFHATPNPMAITSLKDGTIIDVNNAFVMLHEFQREEIIGRKMHDLYVWVDHEERESILELIKEKGAVYNQEVTFRKKSGELRTALYSADIINMNGIECVFGMMNDVTEHKQFLIEMARLERLKLVGEIAAGIGHEIRNPMTTVRGFLQILRTKPECVKYYDYYTLMIEELDRINSIITEFLSLAQNKNLEKKQNNINSIIDAILPLIQSDATNNDITVIFRPETVLSLCLDEKEIRQLILNLVRNGLEAMQPGGVLTLKTYMEKKDIVFSVGDQGEGIDPGNFEKLGTPFFTTKDNGTGLGLAICFSIASRHNAKISFETGDQGTTFFVKFKRES